jgi:hypothetical protein
MKKGRKPGEFLVQKAKHKRRAEIQDAINKMRAEGESTVVLKYNSKLSPGKRIVNTYRLVKIPEEHVIRPFTETYLCKVFNKYLDVGYIECKDGTDWRLVGLKSGSIDYHLKLKNIICIAEIVQSTYEVVDG